MLPIEWLNGIVEKRDGYRRLVNQTGSLSVAAWHLAKAKCQVWEVPTEVPTSAEVRAAARTIARHAGLPASVPSGSTLADECESHGLPVL